MAKFAEGTKVATDKSRVELEGLLQRYGADSTAVFNSRGEAAVAFEMRGRRILFRLKMPDQDDARFTHRQGGFRGKEARSADGARTAWEQACRERWRALVLAVKAKLVSVEEGVETFEEAFMAHVVMPDGRTVSEHVKPRIAQAYSEQKMVPLLPGPNTR
ncbi:MAG: hypothetical protein AB7L90_21205 [Hyphomicrobiaceae bacterium]